MKLHKHFAHLGHWSSVEPQSDLERKRLIKDGWVETMPNIAHPPGKYITPKAEDADAVTEDASDDDAPAPKKRGRHAKDAD